MKSIPRPAAVVLALAAAGLCVSPARADEAREQQLENRVTELERQLQAVLAELRAQKAPAPAAAPLAQSGTAAPKPPPPIQDTTITPGAAPGTKFSFG